MQVLNDFINFIHYHQKRQEKIMIRKEKNEITLENLTKQQAFIESIWYFSFLNGFLS